jgi:hypothetical protein
MTKRQFESIRKNAEALIVEAERQPIES